MPVVRIQVHVKKYDTEVCSQTWGIMEAIEVPSIEKAGTGFSVTLGDSVVTSF